MTNKMDRAQVEDLLISIGHLASGDRITVERIDFEGLASHYEALGLLRRRRRFEGLLWWLGFKRYA